MAELKTGKKGLNIPAGSHVLQARTLIAAVLAIVLAQMALAIPASLNGLFQQDLGTSSAQLTWISDIFLIPVCVQELSFGVLGDLFGRKRLLVVGALLLACGELTEVFDAGRVAAYRLPAAGAVFRSGNRRNWCSRPLSDHPRHARRRNAQPSRSRALSRYGRTRSRFATAPLPSSAALQHDCRLAQTRSPDGDGRASPIVTQPGEFRP